VIQGTVPLSCVVIANPSIVNPETVDLTNTASDQSLGSLTYQCNNAGGFTRTISSLNGGVLKRAGGAAGENTISYQFSHTGGSGLTMANAQLTSPINKSMAGALDFAGTGVTGSARVRIGAASGTLFAGNYGDTITITIAPNN
jgi:spore coat protein U-like protein